jgi:hypothetical protein
MRFLKIIGILFAYLIFTSASTILAKPQHHQHVHSHGNAKLDIAVEGNKVAFDFDTPAEGLYGFEYEPKKESEKKIVNDANGRFTSGASELFRLSPELGCKVTKAEVKKEGEADAPKDSKPDTKGAKVSPKETHSDINASVEFTCTKPVSGQKVTIALIKAFPRLKSLKVQINTAAKQGAETVTKPEQEVSL